VTGLNTTAWSGPGGPRIKERFTWNALLWALVFPQRSHRIVPTVPGTILISLALGIGMAAYNSSSNILFLTLSVLLACLILSGVMSWLNLRRTQWRLCVPPALRVGHDAALTIELRNDKRLLPTYSVWFNLRARFGVPIGDLRPETTFTARGIDIRAALQQAEANEIRGRISLGPRLDPAGEARLDWVLQPTRRGRARLELTSVGSLFPFGFLRKDIGLAMTTDVVVWPRPIAYRRYVAFGRRHGGERQLARAGSSNDLLALRRYQPGDSHRLIHWKASARTRQLLVRQFSAEAVNSFSVHVETAADLWPREEQFELLVSFAATLCEDLFREGSLRRVAIDDRPAIEIRGIRDLDVVLNGLAVVERSAAAVPASARAAIGAVTFAADGPRGVAAFLEGESIASV